MATGLNQLQYQLDKLYNIRGQVQNRASLDLNQVLNMASRNDNAIKNIIDSSIDHVEAHPTIDNINRALTKLTDLAPNFILPETKTYYDINISNLNAFKDFATKRIETRISLEGQINKLDPNEQEGIDAFQADLMTSYSSGYLKGEDVTHLGKLMINQLEKVKKFSDVKVLSRGILNLWGTKDTDKDEPLGNVQEEVARVGRDTGELEHAKFLCNMHRGNQSDLSANIASQLGGAEEFRYKQKLSSLYNLKTAHGAKLAHYINVIDEKMMIQDNPEMGAILSRIKIPMSDFISTDKGKIDAGNIDGLYSNQTDELEMYANAYDETYQLLQTPYGENEELGRDILKDHTHPLHSTVVYDLMGELLNQTEPKNNSDVLSADYRQIEQTKKIVDEIHATAEIWGFGINPKTGKRYLGWNPPNSRYKVKDKGGGKGVINLFYKKQGTSRTGRTLNR